MHAALQSALASLHSARTVPVMCHLLAHHLTPRTCPAGCRFEKLKSTALWQSAVYVADGSAVLANCVFRQNDARPMSLVHAASPRGNRLLFKDSAFRGNAFGSVRVLASQFDSTARVFASPRIDVLNAASKELGQSGEATVAATELFLSPQDAWLRQQMTRPNVSLTHPPFWETAPGGEQGDTPMNVSIAISIFSVLLALCMVVGLIGVFWRRKTAQRNRAVMKAIELEEARVRRRPLWRPPSRCPRLRPLYCGCASGSRPTPSPQCSVFAGMRCACAASNGVLA